MGRLSFYTHIAVALLVGVLAWCFQAARLGTELADERLQASQYRFEVAEERAVAGRRVLAVERTVNEKYQGALNDAIKKQATLQAAADRARRERDGLRNQLSDAEQRLADASPAAIIDYTHTVNELLGQCSQSYQELAREADGHVASIRLMQAAWPSLEVSQPSR